MPYNNIDFNEKLILITGGAGFIGSNIAFHIQENFPNSKIVIFDCFRNEEVLSNGNLKSFGHFNNLINFQGEILCGDISVENDLKKLSRYKFDFVFHQAAISDTRVYDQELVMKTNINSFYPIITQCIRDNSVLVYASSAATYGSLPSPQVVGIELPENPYGFSKFAMDQIAYRAIKENPSLKIVGLRFFNVYGEREFYKAKTSSMIIQLGHQIIKGSSPRLFFNSENIFRDFIYIEDVIQANIMACDTRRSGVYNVGTGVARSFKDIVDILQKELGTSFEVEYFQNPYKDYQNFTQADISDSKKYLQFSPQYTLEKGIKKYIKAIKDTSFLNNF